MLTTEVQLPKLCEQINQHAQDVCSIGAFNLGKAYLATIELYKYTKAIFVILYKPTVGCAKNLALKESEIAI